jgi:hypothetical protein
MENNQSITPDMKCAPSKKYNNDSCFTHDSLKHIASAYNQSHQNDTIKDINKLTKEKLVNVLEDKMEEKYQCKEQTCWTRQKFLENLEEKALEEIQDYTFLPKGPSAKYGWLSTTHINEVIDQYHKLHSDFLFLGAVPYDFDLLPQLEIVNLDFGKLEKDGKHKLGMVINLDTHNKAGSHWVSLYTDLKKNQIYFFDSVGRAPHSRIRQFINRITKYMYQKKYNTKLRINDVLKDLKEYKGGNKHSKKYTHVKNLLTGGFDIKFNKKQHQLEDSECGVYSINFITRLVGGESFESVCNDIKNDEQMNKYRKVYFRNVN